MWCWYSLEYVLIVLKKFKKTMLTTLLVPYVLFGTYVQIDGVITVNVRLLLTTSLQALLCAANLIGGEKLYRVILNVCTVSSI